MNKLSDIFFAEFQTLNHFLMTARPLLSAEQHRTVLYGYFYAVLLCTSDDILICETHTSPEKQISFLRKIENKMADGAIVLDSPLQESLMRLIRKDLPIVQCAEYNPDLSIPYVALDNRKGGDRGEKFCLIYSCTTVDTPPASDTA